MTHPMAVEELQDDEAVEELAADEIAGSLLAAIQHSFDEAMASIDDLARSSGPTGTDVIEPHPGTEKIDLRLVTLPAVPAAATEPTAAMSLAARVVAERPVGDGARLSTAPSGPTAERHTGSARQQTVAPAGHESPDRTTAPRPRPRWWAALSSRFPGSAATPSTA